VSVGDRVTLAPAPDGSSRILISVTALHAPRALPPSGAAAARHAGKPLPAAGPPAAADAAAGGGGALSGAAAAGPGALGGAARPPAEAPSGAANAAQGEAPPHVRTPGEKEVQLLAAVAAMSEAEHLAV
jgi:hypothetical protein